MPQFKVAHLREQGQDMVVVLVNSSFGNKSTQEQKTIIAEIQLHSHATGLAGTVVPVWNDGGRMKFVAPRPWHPCFVSLTFRRIQASVNKTLSW